MLLLLATMPLLATMFLSTLKRNLVAIKRMKPEIQLSTCCSSPSLESPVRTIPSTPKSLRLPSPATDKLMEVTTLTLRLSARSSTSALLTELVVLPSTASSAPTVLSSTRTTSSATGGSTSTAPPPRSSTASTTSTPLRGPLSTPPLATLSLATLPQTLLLILDTLPPLNIQELKMLPSVLDVRDLVSVVTEGRDRS